MIGWRYKKPTFWIIDQELLIPAGGMAYYCSGQMAQIFLMHGGAQLEEFFRRRVFMPVKTRSGNRHQFGLLRGKWEKLQKLMFENN